MEKDKEMDWLGFKGIDYEAGGIAFVGCILVGVGLGLLFHQLIPGAVIGTGVGFIVMALFRWR